MQRAPLQRRPRGGPAGLQRPHAALLRGDQRLVHRAGPRLRSEGPLRPLVRRHRFPSHLPQPGSLLRGPHLPRREGLPRVAARAPTRDAHRPHLVHARGQPHPLRAPHLRLLVHRLPLVPRRPPHGLPPQPHPQDSAPPLRPPQRHRHRPPHAPAPRARPQARNPLPRRRKVLPPAQVLRDRRRRLPTPLRLRGPRDRAKGRPPHPGGGGAHPRPHRRQSPVHHRRHGIAHGRVRPGLRRPNVPAGAGLPAQRLGRPDRLLHRRRRGEPGLRLLPHALHVRARRHRAARVLRGRHARGGLQDGRSQGQRHRVQRHGLAPRHHRQRLHVRAVRAGRLRGCDQARPRRLPGPRRLRALPPQRARIRDAALNRVHRLVRRALPDASLAPRDSPHGRGGGPGGPAGRRAGAARRWRGPVRRRHQRARRDRRWLRCGRRRRWAVPRRQHGVHGGGRRGAAREARTGHARGVWHGGARHRGGARRHARRRRD
mmetsp:Transcript_16090/g.60896  ORF Transcript_16090/g.60896 Transcript_16090/m.60896 type:complete len:486 (-) Transcript_16090:485-1942(-)